MAKKHQSRPSVAARKKVEARKEAERRAQYKQYRKPVLIGLGIVVAAVIVIVLAVDFFHVPNGSVREFMGQLIGVNETSLIRKMEGDGLHYELGRMETPAGYTPEVYELFATSPDSKEQNRYFVTDDASKAIQNVYVSGVREQTSAQMLENLKAQGSYYAMMTDPVQVQISGHDVSYIYVQSGASDTDASVMTAQLIAYVDTVQNSCVLVNCSSAKGAVETLPTAEQMVAELEPLFACLTIPQK